jgi:hypothetical protein
VLRKELEANPEYKLRMSVGKINFSSPIGVPRGVWGLKPNASPPRNPEYIGGVLDPMSKKNRRLDFLLQFTVFSYGYNLLNKVFF